MEPFVQQSLIAVYNLELTWLWRYKWYPTNVSHHGWTVDRTRNKDHDSLQRSLNQKNLVKFCLSCDLKIHKVTPFRSLKVRFDNLISRKMDLSDFEMMQHGKLDYEGIQFWLTPPLLAWRLENCLTSNPVIYLSTYVAKHFLTEWNSGCDVTSVP